MISLSARRRIAALLIFPFVLLLASCGRLHGEFEIQDVDHMHVSMDFGLKKDALKEMGQVYSNAEAFCNDIMKDQDKGFGDATVKPYEEDGLLGCRIEGPVERADFADDMTLTEEDGEFHLIMKGGAGSRNPLALTGFDFKMVFTFPGKVISSKAGTIDGNSVTYTSLEELNQGVDIRAETGGFVDAIVLIVIIVIVGLIALAVLAAIIAALFFFMRKKKSTPPSSFSGDPGAGGGYPGGGSPAPGGFGASSPAAPMGNSPAPAPSPNMPPYNAGQGYGQSPAQPSNSDMPWGSPSPQGQQWNTPPQQGGQGGQPWNNPPQQ